MVASSSTQISTAKRTAKSPLTAATISNKAAQANEAQRRYTLRNHANAANVSKKSSKSSNSRTKTADESKSCAMTADSEPKSVPKEVYKIYPPTDAVINTVFAKRKNEICSYLERVILDLSQKQWCMAYMHEYADKIILPIRLHDLENGITLSMKELEAVCERLKHEPAQAMSAIFYDLDGRIILVYAAHRVDRKKGKKLDHTNMTRRRTEKHVKKYRSAGRTLYWDGIRSDDQKAYQVATQCLCSVIKIKTDNQRHQPENYMPYISSDNTLEKEGCGVAHLAQSWIQQNQPEKGLYISSQLTTTSTVLSTSRAYYNATASLPRYETAFIREFFPEHFDKYQATYEAGKFFDEDIGPFLARAIIYKLQGRLHRDKKDAGPSLSFPVGQYTGGEMILPELGLKLKYEPGSVCCFYASLLYHMVLPFTPLQQTQEQKEEGITPGRIAMVSFNPAASMDQLEDKPAQYAIETAQGRFPCLQGIEPRK